MQGLGPAVKGKDKTCIIDASTSGWGELKVDLLYNTIPIPVSIDEQGNGIYLVTFQPLDSGKYLLNVSFNSINVKGILKIVCNILILYLVYYFLCCIYKVLIIFRITFQHQNC